MMELIDYSSHIIDVCSISPQFLDCFLEKPDEFLNDSEMDEDIVGGDADLS
jgi:hypothetical protein